ncbi:MAG: tRNA (adenosine(37)-N6)-threonylcarbamoyltransferase complex transferase subunit TsaD [Patescibacteria group bacterium]|nr:tRNA (adenosine(37)-N6)-threonylcarbamoyltransferase complex transferase subunit TsaD [Patescibacteria group bacterium]
MKILAIETSCDETAAAVTEGRKILSNAVFSQINIHKKYGGVYPVLAKRAHQEKVGPIIEKALKDAGVKIGQIDAFAATFGPGLVIALEVGLNKAKELALKYQKPLIPVDHIEGHVYSVFGQNRNGLPKRNFDFPFLALIVSGGTTSLIMVEDHLKYQILGKTLDDAAGEALDKAAKMIGLGYPGGPIIEELAKEGNPDFLSLPMPMKQRKDLDFSYSGLKTAFKRELEKLSSKSINKNLANLAASFQETVFGSIIDKLESALEETGVKTLAVGGGVIANTALRKKIRAVVRKKGVSVYFPYQKRLFNDNAAMIGVAAYFKYRKGVYLTGNFDKLDRVGRPELKIWTLNQS